jgi:hypothetical protein
MTQLEVLIGELLAWKRGRHEQSRSEWVAISRRTRWLELRSLTVDGLAAGSIVTGEVTTLEHL